MGDGAAENGERLGHVGPGDEVAEAMVDAAAERQRPDALAADVEPVGRAADGHTVTPVNQVLTPAGRQVELPRLRPQVIALSPDGKKIIFSSSYQSQSNYEFNIFSADWK